MIWKIQIKCVNLLLDHLNKFGFIFCDTRFTNRLESKFSKFRQLENTIRILSYIPKKKKTVEC